jgi:hypothetical protein
MLCGPLHAGGRPHKVGKITKMPDIPETSAKFAE